MPTRAAQIHAERTAKARSLQPEKLSGLHRIVRFVQEHRMFERFTTGVAGVRARLGGLGPGSGFAAGLEYFRPETLSRSGEFRTSLAASPREFVLADLELSLPRLARDRLSFAFLAAHLNSPKIDYYGPGPESLETGRTAYAFEQTAFELRGAVHPSGQITAGGFAGYSWFNVGPSRDRNFASTERVFSPAVTPGLLRQTDFLRAGAFLIYDARSFDYGRPHGGNYAVEYSAWSDQDAGGHSFDRVDIDLRQHFAFLNGQREVALRARAALTNSRGTEGLPFYLQPQLGGANSLRGFRARRFYDNNLVALTGEYRWELLDDVDAAVFADAGQVFSKLDQAGLGDFERSYGFGFRFRREGDVFWRIDLGLGREGPQLWLTFEDIF